MDKYFTDRHNQRWTSDKEARLIGLYEENRLLWDSRHPDYRDKDKRERAMSAIAEGLQDEFDVLNVKNKIKWLRDYFVKELKRELGLTVKTTSHQGTPSQGYVSRWEHFNKWAFLRSIFSADLCSPSTTNAPDSVSFKAGAILVSKARAILRTCGRRSPTANAEASRWPLLRKTSRRKMTGRRHRLHHPGRVPLVLRSPRRRTSPALRRARPRRQRLLHSSLEHGVRKSVRQHPQTRKSTRMPYQQSGPRQRKRKRDTTRQPVTPRPDRETSLVAQRSATSPWIRSPCTSSGSCAR
ncbi:uncharacterized protein [Dermacentor albipictus]|uniref:uncharacterized protein isoform X1 n=1 Tax=Dermacentor albipictus TaxID=60249 RepID=UPI0031FCDDBB